MDVALLTYSTKPRGSVVHTLALAEALAEAGARVTVWTVGRGGDTAFFRPIRPDVTVRIVPLSERAGEELEERVLRSIAALAANVDPAAYDVVHAQDCISANAALGCVRTVHHLDSFTTPVLVRCHERAIREPVAHVCVSRAVAAELRAGWGIETTVIPNGVDATRFAAGAGPAGEPLRREWRRRLGGGPLVLTVGGVEPRKGSLELLEAFALLRRRRPGARLAVAGGETLFDYRAYRECFDARCEELGLRDVVLGPIADTELPALVAAADVFALPSAKEGFGLAAMEALAAGVPLVLSDRPVFREVYGGCADFADTVDELAEALDRALAWRDPERHRRGRELAAHHTWATAAAAHLNLYESLVRPASLGLPHQPPDARAPRGP